MTEQLWILNTSNPGKRREFERLFALHGMALEFLHEDLEEIDAEPMTVVVYKASHLEEGVLVEDTSLDIEGVDVGIHVRWKLGELHEYVGRKAEWRTFLAYRKGGVVCVYEGTVNGTIVAPRGKEGFGFDPFFLPEHADKTLAEAKPDEVNARAKAVEALVESRPAAIVPPITDWEGPWQES